MIPPRSVLISDARYLAFRCLVEGQCTPKTIESFIKQAERDQKYEQCQGMMEALEKFRSIVFLIELKEFLDSVGIYGEIYISVR